MEGLQAKIAEDQESLEQWKLEMAQLEQTGSGYFVGNQLIVVQN